MKTKKTILIVLCSTLTIIFSFSVYSIFKKQSEQKKLLEERLAIFETQTRVNQLDEMYASELFNALAFRAVGGAGKKADEEINRLISEMYERGYTQDRVRLIESQARMKAAQFAMSTIR